MEIRTIEPELKAFAVSTLANVPLLSKMQETILYQLVEKSRMVNYEQGEVLIREEDEPSALYILLHGSVVVFVERKINVFSPSPEDDTIILGEIAAPAAVGEIGFLLNHNRTASVKAKTSVQTLEISKKAFFALFEHTQGFGLGIAQGLARRVHALSDRVVTQTVERAKAKAAGHAEELAISHDIIF